MPGGAQPQGWRPFPIPSEGIEILAADDEGGSTLADVLREFTRVTGQNITMSPPTRQQVEAAPVGLLASVHVPPTQVYSFVEGLLTRNDLVITRLRAEAPALLALYSMEERRNRPIAGQALRVRGEHLTAFRDHSALLIRTVVDVSPANAKEIAGHLRHLTTDTSLFYIYPSGSPTSVVVQGPGTWVVDAVATIDEIVDNHEELFRPASEEPSGD